MSFSPPFWVSYNVPGKFVLFLADSPGGLPFPPVRASNDRPPPFFPTRPWPRRGPSCRKVFLFLFVAGAIFSVTLRCPKRRKSRGSSDPYPFFPFLADRHTLAFPVAVPFESSVLSPLAGRRQTRAWAPLHFLQGEAGSCIFFFPPSQKNIFPLPSFARPADQFFCP